MHWIKGNGKYKQFVKNRVDKICSKKNIAWRYISTTENSADIGSRGCTANKLGELWWKGPKWLPNYEHWPDDIKTALSEESEEEARQVKEVLAVAITQSDEIDKILKRYSLWKALRVTAWIRRFTSNCRRPKAERLKGPLITEEVEESGKLVVRCTQEANINSRQFQNDVERLNLQKNEQGVFICKGRIDGDYPAYLPPTSLLSEKIIMDAHLHTLHGEVGYTMTEVRQQYWIP